MHVSYDELWKMLIDKNLKDKAKRIDQYYYNYTGIMGKDEQVSM